MTMFYLHSLVIYPFGERPRVTFMTRRVSDIASIGTPVIWTAQAPIEPPTGWSPRAHFQACLEQLPNLQGL